MAQKVFKLTEDNIDSIIEEIKEYFINKKISNKDALKLGLKPSKTSANCKVFPSKFVNLKGLVASFEFL